MTSLSTSGTSMCYAKVVIRNQDPDVSIMEAAVSERGGGAASPRTRVNKKLCVYVAVLGLVLLTQVAVFLVTVVCVTVNFPQVWTFSPPSQPHTGLSGASSVRGVKANTSCVGTISEYMKRAEQRFNGSSPSAGGSWFDVPTAVCLLTKIKADVDARTKRLDEEVYRNNRQLLKLSPTQKKKISVYSRRPSAHLHLYHSHEYRPDQADTLEPLLWRQWQNGLSSLREMAAVNDSSGEAIVSIRVLHPGFYHVSSQVTFRSFAASHQALNWTGSRPLHCLYINFRQVRKPSCRQAVVVAQSPVANTNVSHMQGVFRLKRFDVLTVLAPPSHLLDTSSLTGTFLSAFSI
ncbi:uncharacterized protein LOC143288901 isoform X2 [Babylonia areolata]|uniref:uncharacterized protein LOC143288901 isoform X2 n=1 Tax=Babylonia areolata TaxID=304850 RepID=UPI003FD30387